MDGFPTLGAVKGLTTPEPEAAGSMALRRRLVRGCDTAAALDRQGTHFARRMHRAGGRRFSAGKSSLLKAWSVALVLNRPYGTFRPSGACRVLTYNVEDDLDEERMRLSAILRWFGATPADLKGKLRIVGPNDIGTLVVRDSDTGRLRTTDAMDALEEMVEEFKPDVLMLDPLVEPAHRRGE